VTVSVYVPVPPLADVVTVMVLVPDPVTVAGLNVAVAPAGSPAAWKLTALLNPFTAVTATA
jgi:hypothetical protein